MKTESRMYLTHTNDLFVSLSKAATPVSPQTHNCSNSLANPDEIVIFMHSANEYLVLELK